eukprot:GHVU01075474.1.p2 GENE.GHVU01075474.1~~GHVU01075474.1.p2  ORF type:complete len:115 (+),score=10.17 GHVU01075474.1:142-486(+)
MSNEWQHGVCGCFDNFAVCLFSYFVPCYVQGKTAEAVGDSCLLCCIAGVIPVVNLCSAMMIRGKVRNQKNIDGGCITDCLVTWCCYCCVIAQSAQEVNALGSQAESQALSMSRS